MAQAHSKPIDIDAALWARLQALPDHLKGQIIDGELIVQSRPRPRHARVIKRLGRFLSPLDDGDGLQGGESGWWILIEPGVELPGSPEIVPDLAGWRRSTLPELAEAARDCNWADALGDGEAEFVGQASARVSSTSVKRMQNSSPP
jgi:Putative restriction endonuclease